MPHYIDCFVIPVPKKNLAAYRRMAKAAVKCWIKAGAIDYFEVIADDVTIG